MSDPHEPGQDEAAQADTPARLDPDLEAAAEKPAFDAADVTAAAEAAAVPGEEAVPVANTYAEIVASQPDIPEIITMTAEAMPEVATPAVAASGVLGYLAASKVDDATGGAISDAAEQFFLEPASPGWPLSPELYPDIDAIEPNPGLPDHGPQTSSQRDDESQTSSQRDDDSQQASPTDGPGNVSYYDPVEQYSTAGNDGTGQMTPYDPVGQYSYADDPGVQSSPVDDPGVQSSLVDGPGNVSYYDPVGQYR